MFIDEIKDRLLNCIARWCINHCYISTYTIYTLLEKLSIGEIKIFSAQIIKLKEEDGEK